MMKNETKDNMKDLTKDVAKDLSKDLVKDVVIKTCDEECDKECDEECDKECNKDVAKDNVKDLSKDLAKDVANELVKDNMKDLSKEPVKDLSRYEYVRSILIPSKIEVYDNGDRQVNVKCIRYSSNNISLNFKNKLKHIYVKCEGIYKIKDFIYEFNSYFINDRLVYRLFKCIQNDTLLKNRMRVIKLLLYQIIHCKNNHDNTTIQYMVYILWLVILNNYDWK